MQNKKVIKFAAIALLGAFGLTACNDDIIAKPAGYGDNSPVVTIKDNGSNVSVYNNKFDDIYDAIRSGNLASDVLDQLLYQYSMGVFGNYNKVTAAKVTENPYGEITLKQAVKGLTIDANGNYSGNDDAKAFIKAHSAYWNKDKNGKRVKDDFKTELADDADPEQAEYARLDSKWKTIEKRIAQKLYSEISSGTYSEENVFEEIEYLRSLASSIENNVITVTQAVKDSAFKGVLTAKVEDYDVFNKKSETITGAEDFILHREFYQSNYDLADAEAVDQDATYVEDNIIPDIYRQLLVEQYLLDESYDTLGRTSARHISVLAISKNANYAKGAFELMNTFVNDAVFDDTRDDDLETENDNITLDTFKIVSNAWIGAFMSKDGYQNTAEYSLLKNSLPADYFVGTEGNPGAYFQGTAYGDMMEEYEKIDDNPKISENESTYTGSNTYSKEIGKQIKTRELELKDYTSTGWYIKSVGVSSLPESLKNQLFDINVANALDGKACVEYSVDSNTGEWKTNENDEGVKENSLINVVGKIKGQYFLRNTSRIKDVPIQRDILFESDGTYYIVLVEDAIRSINLSKSSYVDADAAKLERLEGYINEIVQIVANNDTYKNLSKKHWLEEMNLKYHDTEVYNYFKTNFPDLFD